MKTVGNTLGLGFWIPLFCVNVGLFDCRTESKGGVFVVLVVLLYLEQDEFPSLLDILTPLTF